MANTFLKIIGSSCRHLTVADTMRSKQGYIGNWNVEDYNSIQCRQLSGAAAWACLICILMSLDTDTINTPGCDRKSAGNRPTLDPAPATFSRIIHNRVRSINSGFELYTCHVYAPNFTILLMKFHVRLFVRNTGALSLNSCCV